MSEAAQDFHEHLELCPQCKDNPFNLCKFGMDLLTAAVTASDINLSSLLARNKERAQ